MKNYQSTYLNYEVKGWGIDDFSRVIQYNWGASKAIGFVRWNDSIHIVSAEEYCVAIFKVKWKSA